MVKNDQIHTLLQIMNGFYLCPSGQQSYSPIHTPMSYRSPVFIQRNVCVHKKNPYMHVIMYFVVMCRDKG